MPTLWLWDVEVPGEVTLLTGPPTWLVRPIGEKVLLLGLEYTRAQVTEAVAAFMNWAATKFGARDVMPRQLVTGPNNHGRSAVGASAVPGGLYTRGNGRGELINGTASGCYLATPLFGVDAVRSVSLSWASEVRAGVGRLLCRR